MGRSCSLLNAIMRRLPIFYDLCQQPCLVVGGGTVALRKVRLLLNYDADITVVAPRLCDGLKQLEALNQIRVLPRKFLEEDVTHQRIVISATNIKTVNSEVADACAAKNVVVNVVDDLSLGSAILGAIVERWPVQVAISTSGSAPVLARILRRNLEQSLPARLGELAALAERYRARVKTQIRDAVGRRRFWEKILEGSVAELVYQGNLQQAEQLLQQELTLADTPALLQGEVYLVGAGPGDPELLTLRALRLMQQSDVVLYDRLVSQQVLDLVRREAELIYVGKRRADHAVPQKNINALLVEHAKQGKRVLRLKGGDPFIFGRGGEEIELLVREHIRFEIVPGVTAASGCAAYAGIPLTHRDYAQSVLFVTGHLKNDRINLDFHGLVKPNQTLVVYMGLVGLSQLCDGLRSEGMADNTPVALVEQGTMSQQKVLVGDLSNMPGKVKEANIHGPTIVIVGDVVRLHDSLSWFYPSAPSAEDVSTK